MGQHLQSVTLQQYRSYDLVVVFNEYMPFSPLPEGIKAAFALTANANLQY